MGETTGNSVTDSNKADVKPTGRARIYGQYRTNQSLLTFFSVVAISLRGNEHCYFLLETMYLKLITTTKCLTSIFEISLQIEISLKRI